MNTNSIKNANLVGSVSRNAGGLFDGVCRLVQSLQMTGIDVSVLSSEDQYTATDIEIWHPVKVQTFMPVWPKSFAYSPEYYPALAAVAPDLIHTHGIWLYQSMATHKYFKIHGKAYMVSPHGMVDPWAMRNSRWKKLLCYWIYEQKHLKNASCLRALCESEARSMRYFGLKNPIAIIPNGIDIPETRNDRSKLKPAPWSGVIEPGKKTLLFLSRIHPKKGLPNLLRAWATVPQSDWVLIIAGWDQGGHEAELKKLCSELGIQFSDIRDQKNGVRKLVSTPTVLFVGPQFKEDKAVCYEKCDGFILPSFSEGLPMVILEAWAHGKPVLMTEECNLPLGFVQGAAIQIKTTQPSIAEGLRNFFMLTEASRRQMGETGLVLIKEHFTWPKIAKNILQVYEWMLGGGIKPACLADF